ncbi:hypothetical protein G7B40_007365 [Aetokthonos hydrillicola Thurmond2011]|jgi:LytS/YehU family sensor histidine kinase|uniref:Uncharacterized protein n=1 Tax=Aetokthonos hydrillicola Thurmond2011 TaxID=2712845 RepID=A0AAP5I8F5_9CYAN|nr:hypothetical protein [Aetokthonos hydrillicola]MBO3459316.1 hypothetical protein [Aetokthonos hydrillicola CCALA 1050]MBW4587743.1 hypothetical protein [Aetokthonos hydrillicola CCALA 1050]MDR9894390.1 hypothetical protein [Aetokthonos hydrillicola Thurmond2011]
MNRALTCTFSAILAGLFGGYISGQITLSLRTQQCQNQPWGLKEVCSVMVTPGAIWEGSTTGIWTGTLLGAFVSGVVTHENKKGNRQ